MNEVRANLLRALESLDGSSSSSPSSAGTAQCPTEVGHTRPAFAASSVITTTAAAAAAAAEQRRLFSFGRPGRQFTSNNKSKGKGKKSPTCTLKFVCLASKDEVKPPISVKEKTTLCNCGLGDGSITFDMNEGPDYCHSKILEKYPTLAMAGGYELLLHQRGAGDGAGFHPIKPPYTPLRLKDFSGQAKIYIRPLQKDLIIECEDQADEEVSELKH